MVLGIGDNELRQCEYIKGQKHQRKQTRRQDVLNPGKYGKASEHEASSGQDNPESLAQWHPLGDVKKIFRNGIQVVHTKVDCAEPKYPSCNKDRSRPGRTARRRRRVQQSSSGERDELYAHSSQHTDNDGNSKPEIVGRRIESRKPEYGKYEVDNCAPPSARSCAAPPKNRRAPGNQPHGGDVRQDSDAGHVVAERLNRLMRAVKSAPDQIHDAGGNGPYRKNVYADSHIRSTCRCGAAILMKR